MGFWKILTPVFCLLCGLGFLSARGAIVDLQAKSGQIEQVEKPAEDALKELETKFAEPALPAQTEPDPPPTDPQPESLPLPQEKEAGFPCYLRSTNGKIGVYTEEGYLLNLWNVDIRTLPPVDRDALEKGIVVASRAELIARMEDFKA